MFNIWNLLLVAKGAFLILRLVLLSHRRSFSDKSPSPSDSLLVRLSTVEHVVVVEAVLISESVLAVFFCETFLGGLFYFFLLFFHPIPRRKVDLGKCFHF